MKNKTSYFEVWNEQDLIEGFKTKQEYMVIKGTYNQEVKRLLQTKLSDDELLGLELGSAGLTHVVAELIYKVITVFHNKEDEKKLESAIRQYNFKIDGEQNIVLYLRELDY